MMVCRHVRRGTSWRSFGTRSGRDRVPCRRRHRSPRIAARTAGARGRAKEPATPSWI